MTETQFLVLVGTVWVAPHVDGLQGKTIGCLVLMCAAAKGLGWL